MMKLIKRFFIALIIVLIIIAAGLWFWLKSTAPDYSGEVDIKGLHQPVKVTFDRFGVPHIEAKNAHDAYMALGYLQAQERLFQMEMIRRVAGGTLSEILGESLVSTDKKLRNLDLYKMAEKSKTVWFNSNDKPWQKETRAFLDGVNAFIDKDHLPVEFTLIGFKPRHFGVEDVYATIGYMAFTFTSALTQDPAVTQVKNKYGDQYLKLFRLDSASVAALHQNSDPVAQLFPDFTEFQEYIPVPIWEGSNNWVVSKDRSKSGHPVLANDTHIKYSQPAVWYEAVLNYPGHLISGYYLAGVPYAVVGNTGQHAWGVTIFPFDNMDLYKEKVNPKNPNQVWENDHWQEMTVEKQIIKVKDGEDVVYNLKFTRHGPVMNEAYPNMVPEDKQPVSLWWGLQHLDATVMQALWYINNAQSVDEFRKGCSFIDILGLNVVYADTDDNIAWWASGRLPKRAPHVNSSEILDGASGKDEVLGFYPFELNPQVENPEDGLLETSNDHPPAVNGEDYPGYYSPGYRHERALFLLNSQNKWSAGEMKKIQSDNYSARDVKLVKLVLSKVDADKISNKNAVFAQAIKALQNWDGKSDINNIGVTIYTKMLYYILEQAMADELGNNGFKKAVSSNLIRSSIERLFTNPDCIWWDNVNTPEKETRLQAFRLGIDKAVVSLQQQLGDDVTSWRWGRVHTLTHVHPIGRKEPFDKVFNVGPFEMAGTNEVVDKEGFSYNVTGVYPVATGPALRFIIDMADPTSKLTIIPTGQSGNVMSPHYADQAQMFVNGEYRTLESSVAKIKKSTVLLLEPED
jgi:penicillin amidase